MRAVVASCAVEVFSTIATASSLEMNSHTPSDARMSTSSSADSSWHATSGVAITPTWEHMWSPSERDIARPGPSPGRSHTRAGPYCADSGLT